MFKFNSESMGIRTIFIPSITTFFSLWIEGISVNNLFFIWKLLKVLKIRMKNKQIQKT